MRWIWTANIRLWLFTINFLLLFLRVALVGPTAKREAKEAADQFTSLNTLLSTPLDVRALTVTSFSGRWWQCNEMDSCGQLQCIWRWPEPSVPDTKWTDSALVNLIRLNHRKGPSEASLSTPWSSHSNRQTRIVQKWTTVCNTAVQKSLPLLLGCFDGWCSLERRRVTAIVDLDRGNVIVVV